MIGANRYLKGRGIGTMVALMGLAMSAAANNSAPGPEDYRRAQGLAEHYRQLAHHYPGRMSWQPDSQGFFYRRSVAAGNGRPAGHEFMWVDVANLRQRPAFDHARLARALNPLLAAPATATSLPLAQVDYSAAENALFIPQGRRLLRCDLEHYRCRVQADLSVSRAEAFARSGPRGQISPDGEWEALIENHNLVLIDKARGLRISLTRDGTQEEDYAQETLSWSPDSSKLALYRIQRAEKRRVHYVESSPADQVQPKYRSLSYPKPGDALDISQPVLVDIASRSITPIDSSLFPQPFMLTSPAWRQDSRAFTFEYNQRGHQRYRVIEVDAETGKARSLIDETSETFIDYAELTGLATGSGKRFRRDLSDGKEIIWASERSGWQHLYLYDGVTGKVKNPITQGDWVVRAVHWVDEKQRVIYFSASGMTKDDDPYYMYGYKIGFDGCGLTRLSAETANHTLNFSPDGKFYVDTYSRYDLPPVTVLYRSADNRRLMEVNRADIGRLKMAGWRPPIPFRAAGRDGETAIWGLIYPPRYLKAANKYPVVESIYAGPHGSFVPKDFSFLPEPLTELGFAVAKIDGMGTNNRSRAFHNVAWRNLQDAGFPDRILWHRAAAQRLPWYDISRGVGIIGVSAGGQSAMAALLFHPELYKVAVADSGSHDNRMDKNWWNEQWMGWPLGPWYAAASNVENAWRLQGKLLLMVGELDDNVDPSSTLQVADRLIKAGKEFDLLYVPGGGHGVSGGAYGQRKALDFFVRHLAGGKTPDWNVPRKVPAESGAVAH
ncbi:DPP IV N-terminal domain-containing protein [Brenneria sp. g21c3]|uniref:DPP IV N-terminal domain-containing protein n=1 Tax=Brenneria sp. g21c3 TaxID=3093893 RepID=UPI002EBDAF62|nr:DPP IV N-terminal domain-containing protein [Brenneria sp. g21c3]